MDPATALMLIDGGTNLIFNIAKKIKEARENPNMTNEEALALIAKWQPLADAMAEDIQEL